MANAPKVDLENRLSLFQVSTHTYKTVEETPILVDLLIPKKLVNAESSGESGRGKRLIVIRIHGGWLILGQREYEPWMSAWILELALKHDAIIVNPDYRLLPEAKTDDILDDMDDLWKWIGNDLQSTVRDLDGCAGISIDLERVLILGDSAGGYLAVQTAITHFSPTSSIPRIRALIAVYPMLDLRSPHWTKDYPKQILESPQFPNSVIDDLLSSVRNVPDRKVISNAAPNDSQRFQFAMALTQRGRFLEVFGEDHDSSPGKRRLHPEDRIIDGSKLSPVLFVHGANDTAVPLSGTEKFVELLKKHRTVEGLSEGKSEKDVIKLAVQPGDHGFENDLHIDDADWMDDSVVFVEKHWLG